MGKKAKRRREALGRFTEGESIRPLRPPSPIHRKPLVGAIQDVLRRK